MRIRKFGRRILDLLTFGVTRELPLGAAQRQDYIKNLRLLSGAEAQRYLFEHLYSNLDVLDNKTNSMIQFISVLLAVYTAAVGYFLVSDGRRILALQPSLKGLLVAGVSLSFAAVLLFMTVERVHWSSVDDLEQPDVHAKRLVLRRNVRTMSYRIGWRFSLLAVILLLIILAESAWTPIASTRYSPQQNGSQPGNHHRTGSL
jgi:hypothetical protein